MKVIQFLFKIERLTLLYTCDFQTNFEANSIYHISLS